MGDLAKTIVRAVVENHPGIGATELIERLCPRPLITESEVRRALSELLYEGVFHLDAERELTVVP